MWRQRWLGVGCVLLCGALSEPAQALLGSVSGSFEGTVQAGLLPLNFTPPHPDSYYDGAPIVGSFEFELVDPRPVGAGGSGYFTDPAGSLNVTYTVRGETFAYQAGLSATPDAPVLLLQPAASGGLQSITLLTSFMPKYEGATLEFIGPGLFSGLDARSIDFSHGHPRLATSFASASAEMLFSVDVRQVKYGDIASPVPEPSTVLLLVFGGLALLCCSAYAGRAAMLTA
jgi:hypothetical protein